MRPGDGPAFRSPSPAVNRSTPGRFDDIEQRVSALFLEQLADYFAEIVNIVSERSILFGKLYVPGAFRLRGQ